MGMDEDDDKETIVSLRNALRQRDTRIEQLSKENDQLSQEVGRQNIIIDSLVLRIVHREGKGRG